MKHLTLADRIKENFSLVKLKSSKIKVPKLRPRKIKAESKGQLKKEALIQVDNLSSILIKAALDEAKKEKKAEPKDEIRPEAEESKQEASGGYGSVQKHYGILPGKSYLDYGKLFSYLGKFRASSPFGYAEGAAENISSTDSRSFALAEKETIEKGSRLVKYMKHPTIDFAITALSSVPVAGMSSGEWEDFKMWMKLDPVMYALKTRIS
ncbi:hypothetical protein HYS31_05085 [Candidatus Woesearchaeota archaeon]|nr:hypothetical protein [Candidatus Woesearchaeota archaeon]